MTDELNETTWPACTASSASVYAFGSAGSGIHLVFRPYDQENDSLVPLVDELRLPDPSPFEPEWRGDYQRCSSENDHEQHDWWRSPERIVHICPGVRVITPPETDNVLLFDIKLVRPLRRPFDQARDDTYPGDRPDPTRIRR